MNPAQTVFVTIASIALGVGAVQGLTTLPELSWPQRLPILAVFALALKVLVDDIAHFGEMRDESKRAAIGLKISLGMWVAFGMGLFLVPILPELTLVCAHFAMILGQMWLLSDHPTLPEPRHRLWFFTNLLYIAAFAFLMGGNWSDFDPPYQVVGGLLCAVVVIDWAMSDGFERLVARVALAGK